MPSECDDYAFCKVCDDSFSIAHGGGNDVGHRHIMDLNKLKTNSSIRQFFAAPSKTANSKAVSVTRAELICVQIVEQNIPSGADN